MLGKFDEIESDQSGGEWSQPNPSGNWLLRAKADLTPALIAQALARRLTKLGVPADIAARMDARIRVIEAKARALADGASGGAERAPWFCSGCPHNTSTRVPEGSRAMAGIGCHFMATWMDRETIGFTQMGGEGVPWIGQAPFTREKHVFANLGDGTYFHSGYLAVRASIAAGVNVTYKILFNDAVAMTGGQPVDGTLTVPHIVAQMRAEGVRRIVVVTDDPGKYGATVDGAEVFHRDHLDWVQRELRETPGCTVLVYDQTCAAEKRRRRKKVVDGVPGFPDPPRRVFINEAVCEGCGDCSVQSACVSVEPLETGLGRKRRINQSPHPSHTASLMTTRIGLGARVPRLRCRRASAAQCWS